MTTTIDRASDLLSQVEEIRPIVLAHRDEADRIRRQPQPIVDAMVERGFNRLLLPEDLAGGGVDLPSFMRAVEIVSAMDGSAGWNFAIGAAAGMFVGHLEEPLAREIAADPACCVVATLAPTGRLFPADGGYRISGQWRWGSCGWNSTWGLFGCFVFDGDRPRMTPEGMPAMCQAVLPRAAFEILDGWNTGGMRGTGSVDIAVREQFVPEAHTATLFRAEPWHSAPVYRLPMTALGPVLTAVCFGIARAAIDAVVDIAAGKVPMGSRTLLRDFPRVQEDVATAEAVLGAARGYLYEHVEQMWDLAVRGEPISMDLRAIIRRGVTYGGQSAARAVDLMYAAAGGSAAFEGVIERCFRDVHVAVSHVTMSRGMMEDAGRVQLGLQPNSPMF